MLRSLLRSLVSRPASPAASDAPALEETVRRAVQETLGVGSGAVDPPDYDRIARILAGIEAAQYMVERMQSARDLRERAELLAFALEQATLPGLVLELGVFRGASLRFIAQRTDGLVHGFDSFAGLPEDWTHHQKKGRFSLDGAVPQFDEPNVRIHAGLFGDTLPVFLAANAGPVRFLHVDCDLYSSSAAALDLLAPRLVPGSVILFDEYLNFPGWRQHEYRAFQEFVAARAVAYRYIGFASRYMAVAVRIG